MSKDDQQKPIKIKKPAETGSLKLKSKGKAEKIKVDAVDKPEKSNLKIKNEHKALSEVNKSETNKSEIEHPDSEIKNMEVHHHPQLEHKLKPWKEYLLEGFMIFIAVMMGFIAENIREDITNNEHARQLTLQLVQDLKADTATLHRIYAGEMGILNANDTLFNLLQQPLSKADTKKIQKFAYRSHDMWPFHPSGGAIGAIKNELHLKQFSDSKIISYIAKYEMHIELVHTLQDITLQYQRSFLEPFMRFHFTPANLNAVFNPPASYNAQMRNLTQNDLTQLAADMVLIRINTNELIRDNLSLKADAVNLLKYVKKQYGLEGG